MSEAGQANRGKLMFFGRLGLITKYFCNNKVSTESILYKEV